MFTSLVLAAVALFVHPGVAGEALGRDQRGALRHLGDAPALVFFSQGCAGCLDSVEVLQAAGLEVLLISEDTATGQSAVGPYLRARGLRAPVVADPDGELRRRFGLPPGPAALLVAESGAVVLRQAAPLDGEAMACAAAALPPRLGATASCLIAVK